MIQDWELWACANQVVKQHGDHALAHASGRAAALFDLGDVKGVATWRAIADRIGQLAAAGSDGALH